MFKEKMQGIIAVQQRTALAQPIRNPSQWMWKVSDPLTQTISIIIAFRHTESSFKLNKWDLHFVIQKHMLKGVQKAREGQAKKNSG